MTTYVEEDAALARLERQMDQLQARAQVFRRRRDERPVHWTAEQGYVACISLLAVVVGLVTMVSAFQWGLCHIVHLDYAPPGACPFWGF